MSDDESNIQKRPAANDSPSSDEDQIGPCISDAAPTKKRKGKKFPGFLYDFSLSREILNKLCCKKKSYEKLSNKY